MTKIVKANIKTGKKAEWTGIIFYKKISDVLFEAVDMCYMGKGPENSMVVSIDYIKYPKLSKVLSNYIMNNSDKIVDCYQGLIHSHIEMDTNPSSVDYNELITNNVNYNGTYLSVICNHKLQFTSLISVEEEEHEKEYSYKWFGELFKQTKKYEKNIQIYKINTELDIEEYDDIDEALKITEEVETFFEVKDYKKLNLFKGNYNVDYVDELNKYFEFTINMDYDEKINILNYYTFYNYSLNDFIKSIEFIDNTTLLKDLKIYSHTNFYKDLVKIINKKTKKYEFEQKI
jgi:hypothetical protein